MARQIDAGELGLPPGTTRDNLEADLAQAVRDAAAEGLFVAWVEDGLPLARRRSEEQSG